MVKLLSRREKGFTLIELLIVIAIIGILATMVVLSVGSYREKARDARRINDLRQITSALIMYYNDNDGYPGTNDTESWGDDTTPGTLVFELQGMGGDEVYLALVSSDPSSMTYFYYPGNNLRNYVIGVDELESEGNQTILGNDVDYSDITNINVPSERCNDPEYCFQF